MELVTYRSNFIFEPKERSNKSIVSISFTLGKFDIRTFLFDNKVPAKIGKEEFFVLGDNSPVSLDSRRDMDEAIVRRADVLGRVWRWR